MATQKNMGQTPLTRAEIAMPYIFKQAFKHTPFFINGKNRHRRLSLTKFPLQFGNLISQRRRLLKL